MNKIKAKKRKSIIMVIWKDAAYSNQRRLPKKIPSDRITFGVFINETKKAVNVCMNAHIENKKIVGCSDGFLIPKKVVKKIKVLGTLDDYEV